MSPSTLTAVRTVSRIRSIGSRIAMAAVGRPTDSSTSTMLSMPTDGCRGANGAEHRHDENHQLVDEIELDARQPRHEQAAAAS